MPTLRIIDGAKDDEPADRDGVEDQIRRERRKWQSRQLPTPTIGSLAAQQAPAVGLLVVDPMPRRVGSITIQGNTRTKERVIRQYLTLAPGEVLDTSRLRESELALIRTRLFKVDPQSFPTVDLDPRNDPADENQNLLVSVAEDRTTSFLVGAGVNTDTGLQGSFVVHERNFDPLRWPTSWEDLVGGGAFRGAGQELRLEATPGTEVQRYLIEFNEPRLLGSDYNLQLSGFYFGREYPIYDDNRMGGWFGVGRPFLDRWRTSARLRLEDVGISDPATPTPADLAAVLGHHFLIAPRLSLRYDSRDSDLNPTTGLFAEGSYEHVFGDFTFPIFRLAARQYITVFSRADDGGKHVLKLSGEFGWSGDDTPIFERFYAGGFFTLRGFRFRGIGPAEFDKQIGGQFLMLTTAEYYLPLWQDFVGAVFFIDAGAVERRLELTDYRVSLGLGLRLRIPSLGNVPLAFDVAAPVMKAETDREQVFSFFIGIVR